MKDGLDSIKGTRGGWGESSMSRDVAPYEHPELNFQPFVWGSFITLCLVLLHWQSQTPKQVITIIILVQDEILLWSTRFILYGIFLSRIHSSKISPQSVYKQHSEFTEGWADNST